MGHTNESGERAIGRESTKRKETFANDIKLLLMAK